MAIHYENNLGDTETWLPLGGVRLTIDDLDALLCLLRNLTDSNSVNMSSRSHKGAGSFTEAADIRSIPASFLYEITINKPPT